MLRWMLATVAVTSILLAGRAMGEELAAPVVEPDPVLLGHPLTLSVQGGAEWYRSGLVAAKSPALTYGLSLQAEPLRFLGIEVGYSGAMISSAVGGGDIDRNGGYAILTPGYSFPVDPQDITDIKPYVFAGVGRDWYSSPIATVGASPDGWTLPYGVGLRLRLGQFSLDARYAWIASFSSMSTFNNLFSTGLHPFRAQALLLAGVNF